MDLTATKPSVAVRTSSPDSSSAAWTKSPRVSLQKGWFGVQPIGSGAPSMWTLIKWLDEPCGFYDWRSAERVHPEDLRRLTGPMTAEFASDRTSAVFRLPANGGGWTPIHVTIDRIELDTGIFAGLIAVREPTADEIATAGLEMSRAE